MYVYISQGDIITHINHEALSTVDVSRVTSLLKDPSVDR